MALDNLINGLPDWEVFHIHQVAEDRNSILFVRRTNSSEPESLAVVKIVPFPVDDDENTRMNDPTILSETPLHPNIIQLYSSHVDVPQPGEMSLIFEFCAGGDLYALSQHAQMIGEALPEAFLLHVLHQVWAGLEHIHRHGISHNDLNMGNLLFRPVGGGGGEEASSYPDVVLADFEFAYRTVLHDYIWGDFRVVTKSIQDVIAGPHPYSPVLKDLFDALQDLSKPLTPESKQELVRTSREMAYGIGNNGNPHRMPPWMSEYFANLKEQTSIRVSTPLTMYD